ncbi:helix-turn-helix transcriptional regulator [Actinokineospora sp. NBRC 105648]|uniref:helix-turn-helix domain-containing protein n=1 Tax=Actinokineospora sp. NBRC 105648 TaxID=3032206 RepID=UPI0024A32667|nr:helix-turn-helix transcriptional regulator [Actinokineospora sp. NBRC 105648]GLZ43279.1 transcriptional regulator [Actinokineospora sp. NBRC 105648]
MTLHPPDTTVRLELLGEELRGYRETAGLSLADVTAKTGISTSKLSRMENGRKPRKIDDVKALLVLYGVRGPQYDDLVALAHDAAEPTAWPEETPSASLRVLESKAEMLVDYQAALVPALLQTVPYAQAVLREVDMVDEHAIEERTTERIRRQAVLRKSHSPRYYAILAENALRTTVGGGDVMRGQLRYLVEAGRKKDVTIRVVPRLGHGHPGLRGSFRRMQFPNRGALVLLENRTSSLFVEDTAEVKRYDQVVVELLSVALDEAASARLITEISG